MEKYTDIKSLEDACKVLDLDPAQVLPDFSGYLKQDREAMTAHAKLVIIARAANKLANKGKEWKPNWKKTSQWKHYPYFEMAGSSGFRYCGCAYWSADSNVGSRLCFISREVAEHIGNQFEDLYKSYFTL